MGAGWEAWAGMLSWDLPGNLCLTELLNEILPCFSKDRQLVIIKSANNAELATNIPKCIRVQDPHVCNHHFLNNHLQPPDTMPYRRRILHNFTTHFIQLLIHSFLCKDKFFRSNRYCTQVWGFYSPMPFNCLGNPVLRTS